MSARRFLGPCLVALTCTTAQAADLVEKYEIVLPSQPVVFFDQFSAQQPFSLWAGSADGVCRFNLEFAPIKGSVSLAGRVIGGTCRGKPVRKGLAAASVSFTENEARIDPVVVVVVFDAPPDPKAKKEIIQVEVCSDE